MVHKWSAVRRLVAAGNSRSCSVPNRSSKSACDAQAVLVVAPQSGRPHSGGLPDRAPGSLVKDPGSKRQDARTQLVWAAKTSRKHDTAL